MWEMLCKNHVPDLIREKASAVMGRPMRIRIEREGAGSDDPLQQLADQFGGMDNVTIRS